MWQPRGSRRVDVARGLIKLADGKQLAMIQLSDVVLEELEIAPNDAEQMRQMQIMLSWEFTERPKAPPELKLGLVLSYGRRLTTIPDIEFDFTDPVHRTCLQAVVDESKLVVLIAGQKATLTVDSEDVEAIARLIVVH